MNTYRFHVYPATPYWHWNYYSAPAFTANALKQTLAGVVVRQISASPQGGYNVLLQLNRTNHSEALADIEAALRQFGYDIAQVLITEWVTTAVEGSLLGGAGGGAVGSATKDPILIFAGAIIGLVVGAVVGSTIHAVKAAYQADRIHPFSGGWNVTPVGPPTAQPGLQIWLPV